VSKSDNKVQGSKRKPFVKPELRALDVRQTQTGGAPDPNEFNPFLNLS
jgi:hypothetical protein